MAFLITIEVSQFQKESTFNSKLANRGNIRLKRLACSINYDSKGVSASPGRGQGRGCPVLNEA